MALTLFSSTDVLLATFSFAAGPLTITPSTGIGKSGDVFGLDATSASQLTTLLATSGPNARFGMSTTVANEQGGIDTFFLNVVNQVVAVPEPSTMALFAIGLLGMVGTSRSRRKHSA